MTYLTLISTFDLAAHLSKPDWAILDCRYVMAAPEKARHDYLIAHIPGAIYVDLNGDLASPQIPGVTGRHPLPSVESIAEKIASWGIGPGVQVVCYDDAGGALAAARAWWVLRWLGHNAVAVLDGGWQKWLREGRAASSGVETRSARSVRSLHPFTPHPDANMIANAGEVERIRNDPDYRLFDARSYDRFCGQNETIDPVAGHIPGAISAPYADNLTPDLTFKPAQALRERYERLLGDTPGDRATFYCGSGVTAAHDILALRHVGLGDARLYLGSWSDWITKPERPVDK